MPKIKSSLFFIVCSLTLVCLGAVAKNSPCDEGLASKIKMSKTKPSVYKYSQSNFHFEVGGASEEYLGSLDREAVKKSLMYCSPGIAECLKKIKFKDKITGVVSFDLIREKEMALATRLKFTTNQDVKVNKCFESVWAKANFPGLGQGVAGGEVKVPFQVSTTQSN